MTEWQPMGTAPRDGTEVLCFIPEHKSGSFIVGCDYRLLSFIQDVGWVNRALYKEHPTHWMPNLKPPKEKTDD